MARIVSLHLYPVKSCRGIDLDDATVGAAGLEAQGVGDREWMVVDAGGSFVTQREAPRMALIVPAVEDGALVLRAPGMAAVRIPLELPFGRQPGLGVRVWNHACRAFDEGDAVAEWLSGFLGRRLRLARFDPAHRRLSNRERTGNVEAPNRFSDGYPILMISEASLADLNDRLQEAGREPLPMNRFRPNIVIGDVGPFDEDRFVALRLGDAALTPVKPCPRCPMPSIDQATGTRGPDPLDVLARYRDDAQLGVVFGQNVIVTAGAGARLARGQAFETEWNF
ncbi:MAG: MOSC N-terminal beta barrel domain-containing protein [Burkholderiales bacterium]|nr:MOSC N-terminal beta barrel domain-containing protein [Burkholderiales bacterium]